MHLWSSILDYTACVYDVAEILFRTDRWMDEQGDSRSLIIYHDKQNLLLMMQVVSWCWQRSLKTDTMPHHMHRYNTSTCTTGASPASPNSKRRSIEQNIFFFFFVQIETISYQPEIPDKLWWKGVQFGNSYLKSENEDGDLVQDEMNKWDPWSFGNAKLLMDLVKVHTWYLSQPSQPLVV